MSQTHTSCQSQLQLSLWKLCGLKNLIMPSWVYHFEPRVLIWLCFLIYKKRDNTSYPRRQVGGLRDTWHVLINIFLNCTLLQSLSLSKGCIVCIWSLNFLFLICYQCITLFPSFYTLALACTMSYLESRDGVYICLPSLRGPGTYAGGTHFNLPCLDKLWILRFCQSNCCFASSPN